MIRLKVSDEGDEIAPDRVRRLLPAILGLGMEDLLDCLIGLHDLPETGEGVPRIDPSEVGPEPNVLAFQEFAYVVSVICVGRAVGHLQGLDRHRVGGLLGNSARRDEPIEVALIETDATPEANVRHPAINNPVAQREDAYSEIACRFVGIP